MEKMNKFNELEKKYEVDKIKVNNIQIWPFLRTYIALKFLLNKQQVKLNKSNILKLLLNFFRGIHYFFSNKFEFLAFSDTDRRILVEDKYYDRLVDFLAQEKETLIIETPLFSHYPKENTYSEYLASRLPMLFLEHFICLFIKKPRIESEDVLINILNETSISINYYKIIKKIKAQEILMNFLLKFKKNIKGVFIVVPYTKAGIIKACKKKSIPVIELQHGIINNLHPAYNIPLKLDRIFLPDYLLTYGDFEKEIFNENNFFIENNKVIPIGHSIIEYYRKKLEKNSVIQSFKNKYTYIVAITGQVAFDSMLIPFIIDTAQKNDKILYIYIPRGINYFTTKKIIPPQNIIFLNDNINTYEIISNCHFHATVTSTCSIEALCMGIQNIFININNWSKSYYSHLESKKYNYFANTPDEFLNIIFSSYEVSKQEIIEEYAHFIKIGYESNFRAFLHLKFA